jgi:hypothetical protein
MSFTDDMFKIFEDAIRPAIDESGFKPLIISKEQIPSDTTINDRIIASIKKSRFTIPTLPIIEKGSTLRLDLHWVGDKR